MLIASIAITSPLLVYYKSSPATAAVNAGKPPTPVVVEVPSRSKVIIRTIKDTKMIACIVNQAKAQGVPDDRIKEAKARCGIK